MQIELALIAAVSELEDLERRRQINHELGVDRVIAEEQAQDLRAWRDRNDEGAFRRHTIRAENAAIDARRLEDAHRKVESIQGALAGHRKQHSAFYSPEK